VYRARPCRNGARLLTPTNNRIERASNRSSDEPFSHALRVYSVGRALASPKGGTGEPADFRGKARSWNGIATIKVPEDFPDRKEAAGRQVELSQP